MSSTIVCVASGPSFDTDQAAHLAAAQYLKKCRVLVVNDNYRMLPDADWLYACDGKWWVEHYRHTRYFRGSKWTSDQDTADRFGINLVRMWSAGNGLCVENMLTSRMGLPAVSSYKIHAGGNSGYQAVNLAYHFGAKRIILVGYDMQATGGRAHWFGDHPSGLHLDQTELYESWRRRFKPLVEDLKARSIEVVNCTKETALTCAPRSTLETELPI
jgi:hypothetical protein